MTVSIEGSLRQNKHQSGAMVAMHRKNILEPAQEDLDPPEVKP